MQKYPEKDTQNMPKNTKPNGYNAQEAIRNCGEILFQQCQSLHENTQKSEDLKCRTDADVMYNLFLQIINLNLNGAQVRPGERMQK